MQAPQCYRDLVSMLGMNLQSVDMSAEVAAEAQKLAKKMGTQDIQKLAGKLLQQLKNQNSPRAGIEYAAKKRNLALQTKLNYENFLFVTDTFRGKEWEGIEALLVGSQKSKYGSRYSVDALQTSMGNHYTSGFLADVEALGSDRVKMLASGKFDREISLALASLSDPTQPFGGSAEILDIAKVMHKWLEKARNDANMNGAFIGELPGYIVRQNHNEMRLQQAGMDVWVNDMMSSLDWDKTADGLYSAATFAEREEFLQGTYDNIVYGRVPKAGRQADPLQHYGSGRIGGQANKMSQQRVLHFKDADTWFDYNLKYGDGNLRDTYVNGLRRMAHDTALMKIMGPSPQAGLERLRASTIQAMKKSHNAKGLDAMSGGWWGRIMNDFSEVSGSVNVAVSPRMASISSMIRAIIDMVKLGGAVISSITDLATIGGEMAYQGRGFFTPMFNTIGSLVGMGATGAEKRAIAADIGIGLQGLLGSVVSRFGGETSPGFLSNMHRKFFKFNLLTQWTDNCRIAAGMMMSSSIARDVGKTWDMLSMEMRRILRTYRIQDWEWNEVIRKGKLGVVDGTEYLTPGSVASIADTEIEKVLIGRGETPTFERIEQYRQDLAERFRMFFTDRANYAVLEPDARTRAFMRQGSQRGTVGGELLRFIGQFKSFPVAYARQILGREIYGRMAVEPLVYPNGTTVTKGWKVDAAGSLARLILVNTLLGYGAMTAKQYAKGLSPRDPMDPKTWVAAFTQGGGAGIFGDFIFGEKNRFGGNIATTLLGPAASTINEMYDIYARIRDGDKVAKSALKFAMNNTPYSGLFYIHEPFMYMLGYQMLEAIDPGSFARQTRRLRKEYGQEYIYGRPWGL